MEKEQSSSSSSSSVEVPEMDLSLDNILQSTPSKVSSSQGPDTTHSTNKRRSSSAQKSEGSRPRKKPRALQFSQPREDPSSEERSEEEDEIEEEDESEDDQDGIGKPSVGQVFKV